MQDLIHQIDQAIHAHNVWKEVWRDRLTSAGDGTIDVNEIERDDVCAFGQWLYGRTVPEKEKQSEDYAKVLAAHKEFHFEAGHIIRLITQNMVAEARAAMTQQGGQYFRTSTMLIGLLEQWKGRVQSENR